MRVPVEHTGPTNARRAVMIIANQQQVTPAVRGAIARPPDPRFREVMSALVRHLHDFAREVKLTEREFEQAVGYVVALGQHTNDSHNEAVLMSGSLGLSTLICLLNNGNNGQTETAANLLGPFWRMHSPRTENGGSIVRSPPPRAGIIRQRARARHRGPADRGRRGRRVALVAGRLLRAAGPQAGAHEPARQ